MVLKSTTGLNSFSSARPVAILGFKSTFCPSIYSLLEAAKSYKMQTASSMFWTRVAEFISSCDNRYSTSAFLPPSPEVFTLGIVYFKCTSLNEYLP